MPHKPSTHLAFFTKSFSLISKSLDSQKPHSNHVKPSPLVPNLNEMMEEYVEREEESVQVTQEEIGQKEERAEARAKVEQSVEETRKRKR